MTTFPDAQKPPCTRYITALPGLRAGTFSFAEQQALCEHLRSCATCRAQAEAASAQVIEDAVRRHYGIPNSGAESATPFLSLDDIRQRAAVFDFPESNAPNQEHELDQIELLYLIDESDELEANQANSTLVHLNHRGTKMRTKQERSTAPVRADLPSRPSQPARAASRWRASVAVAAVIALIAVFALVMHSFAGQGHGTQRNPNNPAIHNTQPGKWVKQYTLSTKDAITVAPGDPSVIYRVLTSGLAFQRSDDGGKAWKTYTVPSQKIVNDPQASLTLQVSPLDAQMVFATIWSNTSNPNCPPALGDVSGRNSNLMAETAVLSGGYTCTFQYVSTDGGATWATPQTPIQGALGSFYFTGGYGLIPPFVAQGNRLYTALAPDINGAESQGFRLVSSSDGIHWSAADAPLAVQNLRVMEYAATPDGSTLFATTRPISSVGGINREFWRSDDGGAHWTDLGEFPESPAQYGMTYLLGAATIGGKTVVYYGASEAHFLTGTPPANAPTTGIAPDNVYASVDNGKTWQAAPTANIPSGQRAALEAIGTLGDGSLVLDFDTRLGSAAANGSHGGNVAFYAWKPGDSGWTQLSGALAVPQSADILQSTGAGYGFADAWLTPARNGSPAAIHALIATTEGQYTLWSCALS